MKLLDFDKVLCISPHPDDVEVGMLCTTMKYYDTEFDVLCLTKGGAKGFDSTNEQDRRQEVDTVWDSINPHNVDIFHSKFDYFEDTNEPGWINYIENEFVKKNNYDCIFIPTGESDDSMFEHKFVNRFGTALCRFSNISLIEYRAFSTLNSWQPNFFVSVNGHYKKKLKALSYFKSQNNKSYFQKETLDSFHSNFQCSKKGLGLVEQFKIMELFGGEIN